MGAPPRLSIGLPVYDGAEFLGESIESLLGQTYEDFELIISDNASTDETPEICRRYARLDSRIRYYRQADNIGSAANHNFVLGESRGELFKWASHDDVYARQLLERCVEALDACPEVVLAHCLTAMIDSSRKVTLALSYPLATSSPRAPERFRSVLFSSGGDDFYGVMRKHSIGPALHLASCHRSDRVLAATLSLYGPFAQIPDWLYFRREHPERPCDSEQPLHGWHEVERDWPLGRANVRDAWTLAERTRSGTRHLGCTPNTSGIRHGHPTGAVVTGRPRGVLPLARAVARQSGPPRPFPCLGNTPATR